MGVPRESANERDEESVSRFPLGEWEESKTLENLEGDLSRPLEASLGSPEGEGGEPVVSQGRAQTSQMKSLCLALRWKSRRRSLEARGSLRKKIDLWRPFEVSIGRAKRARRSPLGVPSLLYLSATQCDL